MKLAGIVSEGSGASNEDAAGFIEKDGEVVAAWVLDGVTGINGRTCLPAASDAAWLVARTEKHLRSLAGVAISLELLLSQLVGYLIADWVAISHSITLPEGYDPPATCLLLVKRYADGWRALRLGDSHLLTDDGAPKRVEGPPNALAKLEEKLIVMARHQRAKGVGDFGAILAAFHPQLMASRRARNTPGNHSILVADTSALALPEYIALGEPRGLLLCSDGFYRAVDTYGLSDEAGLMVACSSKNGVHDILSAIRSVEASDAGCGKFPRFKPADDASAVMLVSPT